MANFRYYTLLLVGLIGIYLVYSASSSSTSNLNTSAATAATAAAPKTTSSTIHMSQYIVTLKESADDSAISKVKEAIQKLGGEIVSEYSLIKGFVIKLPEIHTDSVKKLDNVATFEEDKEVKIQ